MAKYTVVDNNTGKMITFDWTGTGSPTDADMEDVFKQAASLPQTQQKPVTKSGIIPNLAEQLPKVPGAIQTAAEAGLGGIAEPVKQAALLGAKSPIARPALEIGGSLLGGAAGTAVAGPGVGTFAGESLGYAGGKQLANLLESKTGQREEQYSLKDLGSIPRDVVEGAAFGGATRLAGTGLKYGAKAIGAIVKPLIGRTTGAGTGAVEEAIQSGKTLKGNVFKSQNSFDKALRGETKDVDVVQDAHTALSNIKAARRENYIQDMEYITKGEGKKSIEITPIADKLKELVKRYVPHDSKGVPLWSRLKIGKEGSTAVKDIKEIMNLIKGWGSKEGDRTVKGLDSLKSHLDDFYSDSSKARAFVADLRNTVKNTIVKAVPGYGEMTKKYAQASNLIKDLESGLMMRKQGISGRIVADQTLRRLVSAMRDNFPLRKELVEILGEKGGKDIVGGVAGYALNPVLPRGLAGTGPAIVLEGALAHLNPSFAGLLALSSPRLMGEFLRLFGRGLQESGKMAAAAKTGIGYGAAKGMQSTIEENVPNLLPEKKEPLNVFPENNMSKEEDKLEKTITPNVAMSSESARTGVEAYHNRDYNTSIEHFRRAIMENPEYAKEYRVAINQIMKEQKELGKYGIMGAEAGKQANTPKSTPTSPMSLSSLSPKPQGTMGLLGNLGFSKTAAAAEELLPTLPWEETTKKSLMGAAMSSKSARTAGEAYLNGDYESALEGFEQAKIENPDSAEEYQSAIDKILVEKDKLQEFKKRNLFKLKTSKLDELLDKGGI